MDKETEETVIDFMLDSLLCVSRAEGRRLIEGGHVTAQVEGNELVIQKGKRQKVSFPLRIT